MQENRTMWQNISSISNVSEIKQGINWSGKMEKLGKFRSAPLIFPLPYTDKLRFIPHCHAVLEPWHISYKRGANKLSTDPNSNNIYVTLWRVCLLTSAINRDSPALNYYHYST